jgi:hypothetical protein
LSCLSPGPIPSRGLFHCRNLWSDSCESSTQTGMIGTDSHQPARSWPRWPMPAKQFRHRVELGNSTSTRACVPGLGFKTGRSEERLWCYLGTGTLPRFIHRHARKERRSAAKERWEMPNLRPPRTHVIWCPTQHWPWGLDSHDPGLLTQIEGRIKLPSRLLVVHVYRTSKARLTQSRPSCKSPACTPDLEAAGRSLVGDLPSADWWRTLKRGSFLPTVALHSRSDYKSPSSPELEVRNGETNRPNGRAWRPRRRLPAHI